jgi:Fe-S cluster assembly scaffold protein SufB
LITGVFSLLQLDGLTLCCGKRTLDCRTDILHNAPKTISNQVYKAVLSNAGSAIYKAGIFVPAVAQQTSAKQVFKALLLNNPCSVNAIPVLKIGADDVECKHGVAIADLRDDELWYLATRGVKRSVGAFVNNNNTTNKYKSSLNEALPFLLFVVLLLLLLLLLLLCSSN